MTIPDPHQFDPRKGCRDLITRGFTLVDDFTGTGLDRVQNELLDELGWAADEIELDCCLVPSIFGTIYAIYDPERCTKEDFLRHLKRKHPWAAKPG